MPGEDCHLFPGFWPVVQFPCIQKRFDRHFPPVGPRVFLERLSRTAAIFRDIDRLSLASASRSLYVRIHQRTCA